MSETAIAPEGGLQRLGVMLSGAVLALSVITLAHAALPRPVAAPEAVATPAPPPPQVSTIPEAKRSLMAARGLTETGD